jgi:hypothetical protein
MSGNFHAFSSTAADARPVDLVLQFILFDAFFLEVGQDEKRAKAIASNHK